MGHELWYSHNFFIKFSATLFLSVFVQKRRPSISPEKEPYNIVNIALKHECSTQDSETMKCDQIVSHYYEI